MREKYFCQFRMFVTFLLLTSLGVDSYAESVTYVQTSKSETKELSKPDGAKVVFNNTYNGTYNTQISEGNRMTYTFCGFDGCTITGITLKMRSNQSSGAGSLDIKVGDASIAKIDNAKFNSPVWYGAWSDNYVDIKPDFIGNPQKVGDNEYIVISIAATENSLYCQSVTIDYEIPAGYIESPTLPASCSFIESMMVEITNNMDGATIYYTTDGSLPSVDNGNVYTTPFTITETTTVKAVAVKEEDLSDIAEATYTKIEDYYQISFSINGTVDADNDIFMPYGGGLTDSSLPDVELPKNIKLKGWSRNMNSTETIVFPIIDIKEDLTLYAVFEQVGCFELVTDASALTEGDRVAIACPEYSKVISTSDMIINDVPCAVSTKVDMPDDALIPTEDTRVFVLHKNSDGSFMFEDGGKFLTCPEDDNRLSMQAPKQNMHLWTVTIADHGVATIKNNKYSRAVKYNSTNPRFACYASGQKSVSIYKEITPTTISTAYTPLQISAVGYSTMYLDKDVTIPTNVEAYLATEVGDGYIVMTQHRGLLPKETGIILKGDEGKYAFMHSEATAVVKSLLKGTLSNEYVSGGGYVLSVQDGVVGLYAAKLFDGKFLNNANKAYLPASVVPKELQSNGFRISVGSETCINRPSLEFDYLEGIYDLQGRKVLKMEKGIYIVNGKKVLVK